ncbi:MAG: DUF1211 domain-containing protein [Bacteroidetes bacterium]|nr:DUF1211 domain-containing protein [Bacteroidota bacterium]
MENGIKEYTPGTNRMDAFSDGVFAIVVTLLVLELRVPVLPENFSTQDVLRELLHLSPKFISFAMSFVIVAIFWVNHHQFFHSLEKTDRAMLWYNNLLLFWLSFVPFPTAFIGEHPVSMIPVMLYGAVLFFASVSFNLMLRHAVKSNLFQHTISDKVLRQSVKRGKIGPVIYFVSIISAFISVYISLAIFLLVPVFYFSPQKIVRIEE